MSAGIGNDKQASLLLLQASSSSPSNYATNLEKYNLPVLLLGTVFVVAAGAIPQSLKTTAEGNAIYIGIQYAYSDILILNIPNMQVKQLLAFGFLVLFPWVSDTFFPDTLLQTISPLMSWKEAIEFAGTSFVIEGMLSISSSNSNVYEELIHRITIVGIVHALVFSSSYPLSSSKDTHTSSRALGHTLENIGAFVTWRVGRRFANLLETKFAYINTMQILIILLILLVGNKYMQQAVGPSFPKVANDLMVMIGVYRLAASIMFVFQQGDAKDAVVLLFAGMVAVKLFLKLFV